MKFCGRHCYLRYSVEVAKPIEKARARLAAMGAEGLVRGTVAKPRETRGKIAESNKRRARLVP